MIICVLTGLGARADFEINVSILFGLDVSVKAVINLITEVLMENPFILLIGVWCGVAFLRA